MNKRFALMIIGILVCLTAALMMFCQERCFLGVDLEHWPAVLGIVGIGIISTSTTLLYTIGMKKK